MKTSRAIHPERLTSNHAASSIQLDLPPLWSSKGICYFPDLFGAVSFPICRLGHWLATSCQSGAQLNWQPGRGLGEDKGSFYAFVISQRHSMHRVPRLHSGAATRHCDLGPCNLPFSGSDMSNIGQEVCIPGNTGPAHHWSIVAVSSARQPEKLSNMCELSSCELSSSSGWHQALIFSLS